MWRQLFELPEQPSLPLQARLRAAVVHAVQAGRLAPGAALPSSRDLAQLLGLSRNTVTAVYQQLVDDGFLQSRARSGFFVDAQALRGAVDPASAQTAAADAGARPPQWAQRVLRSMTSRPTLAKPLRWRDYQYPFVYGGHDPSLFPIEEFRECFVRTLARARLDQWAPDFETEDVPDLVEQIRQRVLPKRGVFALPEEIIVTVGAQQALHLLAEALLDRASRVGFEEPGYPHARNCFALREPRWLPLRVDADGVVVDALPALDYVFVTPSQQSPTTVTLSLPRRHALLAAAAAQDFVVIEDDYEAENLYAGEPIPALKSLDRGGRVIYIGSLAKSLAPALRLGYIVAPRALVAELRALRHVVVRHPSTFLQHAYALYLALGHHESHARRLNLAMRERVRISADALARALPDFGFREPHGGASLWVRAPDWVDAAELAREARRHGVLIEAGDVFFHAPPAPCPYFRLRLSSIAPQQIAPGIAALARAVDALRKQYDERRQGLPSC